MTDKEKRTLKDGVKNLIGKYKTLEHGIIEVLENNILSFIDSMQEEEIPPKFPLISQKENPVCAFSTNRYTDEDRKVLCDGCKEECEYAQKKEPVSKDLEKEIEQYCIHHGYLDSFKDCGYTFNEQVGDIARHFANWQKKQDQSTIELAEDYAMLAGMEKMKEKMMAKAIDAKLLEGHLIRQEGVTHPLHVGDKVKVITIKED